MTFRRPLGERYHWREAVARFIASAILSRMADAVRTSIAADARLPDRRTLDERLMVRWPRLYAALSRTVLALPPRSWLRRSLLRRNAMSAWGAWLRGDLDLVLVRFAPDFEYRPPREWQAAGMRSVYRGHAGLREWAADMREAWEWIENRPVEVVDGGKALVFVNHVRLRARSSGVEFNSRFGFAISIQRGLVVREQDFSDLDEALRAADVEEPA
jgi:ketosteroid isomerase-like protein